MVSLQRSYLENTARVRRDDIALRSLDTGETVTYGELDEAANSVGNALHERGLRQGDRVALALYNTFEFPISLYACHKRGFVPVALNYRFASSEFRHAVAEINPAALVYDAAIEDRIENAVGDGRTTTLVRVDGGTLEATTSFKSLVETGRTETPPQYARADEDISYMFYTSGTTGDPKAVAHSVRSGRERMMMSILANRSGPTTVCLLLLPLFHGGGMDSALRATVASGAELILAKEPSWRVAPDAIEEFDVTDIRSVPTTLRRVLDNVNCAERDFSTIECWRVTGAVLGETLAREVTENITSNLYNSYGSSESGTNVVLRPKDLPEYAGSVGKPLPGNDVRVIEFDPEREVDPDETVPQGEEGEVIVDSPQLYRGYYENEPETRDRVREGWYYTHDVGRFDDEGYLHIEGRTDDMILSGGELISAVEVEDVLEAHEDVKGAIVVGRSDEEWGQRVTAFVASATRDDESILQDRLDEYCIDNANLADYKRPREYRFVDELERNETGKKLRVEYQE